MDGIDGVRIRQALQSDGIEASVELSEAAQEDEATVSTEQALDPASTQQAWAAHQAELHAVGLEASLRPDGGNRMPKDWMSLEEWYRESPPEVRTMDQGIWHAERALSEAIERGQCVAPEALTQQERGLALVATLMELAAELRAPSPDMQKITSLADRADAQFLDYASEGNPAKRALMASMYGRSIEGGGAFGNALARSLGDVIVKGPPPLSSTMEPIGPRPATGQASQTSGSAPAGGTSQTSQTSQTGPATRPEGYDSLDGARNGAYLRRGSRGPEVEALQRALNAAGIEPPLEVDGKLGPLTEAAIRQFQQQHGCAVDGIVGPETMGALDEALGLSRRSGPTSPGQPFAPGGSPAPGGPGGPSGPGRPGTVDPDAPRTGAGGSVIDIARSQLGVREATGNNDGIPAQRYSFGQNEAWCANFVSWCFRQAGNPLPGNQDAIGSCDTMRRELEAAGRFYPPRTETPQPGDIIFFGTPGDMTHVGIVTRVEGGKVYTIEGNSGDRVAERSYDLNSSRIQGYGRG
jgi:uncharacterized protein (TIGR02594 family)